MSDKKGERTLFWLSGRTAGLEGTPGLSLPILSLQPAQREGLHLALRSVWGNRAEMLK